MKNIKGFTLIEVLISLGIFVYVFSGLMILFIQFSKNHTTTEKCSPFTFLLIQKKLTETDSLEISSTSDEVYFDTEVLRAEGNALYLFKAADKGIFLNDKSKYQIDSCATSFLKSSTSTLELLNNSKCVDFQYKQAKNQTVCALR